ncbi:hypothetical protein VYU27_006149 [Nannochloropsis oceanica]
MSHTVKARDRPEELAAEMYPAPINPAVIYAAGGPAGYHQAPVTMPQAVYDIGGGDFYGGCQRYSATQPAYAMAHPTYSTAAVPTFMGQSATVHGVGGHVQHYGGLSDAPPSQFQQQSPHCLPPHRPNHAAGGRTPYSVKPTAVQHDVEAGGFGEQTVSPFMAKAEKQMRMAFIRKVYTILSCQLLLSALFCAYVTLDGAANAFVLSHQGLYVLGIVASVVVLLLLMCYRSYYPVNLGLLAIWTFCEAYTIGIVTATFARAGEGELVVQALAITFVVFFALTIFTFQAKIDFSFLGGILFASTSVLIIWGIIGAIFGFRPGFIYSLLGAVLFSLYIVFDTYMLMEKLDYSEWLLASISLYLDIINLFIFILQMLVESRRRQE